MKIYIEEKLHRYLDDLASAQPAPGGGSTAALSGAMGAALGSMVCRLTIGKDAYAGVQREIEELLKQTEHLRLRFQQLMQEDIEAYERLSACYKLPRETSEERAARTAAIQKQLVTDSTVNDTVGLYRSLHMSLEDEIERRVEQPAGAHRRLDKSFLEARKM